MLESDIRPGWRDGYLMADINHPIDLLPAFDWGPDVVFLLSAMVSRVTCEQASGLAISTNLGGINNVLQLCKRVDRATVFFSTSEVYGPECDPMDEELVRPEAEQPLRALEAAGRAARRIRGRVRTACGRARCGRS